jgi:membrane-bound lytic murein transglycosylase B
MKLLNILAVAVLFISASGACVGGDYSDNPQAQALIDEMVQEHGFERAQLEALIGQAERKDSILKAIARPAEKTKPWHEYREIFVTEKRAEQGLEFYRRYAASLQRAQREFGVPAHIVVAIIGVETRYGRNKGSYRVLDSLSTLAFDYPKRSKFFTSELKAYLLMTREQGLQPDTLKGSYAGAMGFGQFIPSSYRAYALDFDGDGVVDILNNPVDAIGSVANYFSRHGWRTGAPVTVAAVLAEEYPQSWFNDGLKPRRTAAELAAAGIRPQGEFEAEALATAMEFEGSNAQEYWVGWYNFYVITRYNHSAMYAMSVYQLSQDISARLAP